MENLKFCKRCQKNKNLICFYKGSKYKDGYRPICIDCFKLEKSLYQRNNKQKNVEYHKRWSINPLNKETIRKSQYKYFNKKYKNDILFKLRHNLRRRLRLSLKSKKWHKDFKFNEYIGCSLDVLKIHIEKQFQPGMSWDNYGKWHLDHIIPLSLAKTEEELYKLCHYTNIQPLWAIDNIKKSNKVSNT